MLSTTQNPPSLYGNFGPMIGAGIAPPESLLPLYNSQTGDLQTKWMSHHLINQTMKDDSGVTFNDYANPLSRKRLRDSSMVTTSDNNSLFISVPSGKIPSHSVGVTAGSSFSFLGEDLSLQLMQQQLEVDRLISLHMEKVRLEMEERTRKQSVIIIQAIKEAFVKKLREMEEQMEKIGKINWSLEERMKSLCLENQIWRDLAQSNEATANELRSNLEQVLLQTNNERVYSGAGAGTIGIENDDAESCCGSSGHGFEETEDDVTPLRWKKVAKTNSNGERKQVRDTALVEQENRKRICKRCTVAESSVLLLPCRHLCLCAACGPTVDVCPVCNATKNASVNVNLS